MKIEGYEKAWNAFANGSGTTVMATLLLHLASSADLVDPPSRETMTAAIVGFASSFMAAIGAYLAHNSGTYSASDVVSTLDGIHRDYARMDLRSDQEG